MEQVSNEIENAAQKYNSSRHQDNLTKEERRALHNLQQNKDRVTKPADKGSAVVIMSTTDYIAEGNRQLHGDTYKELLSDPTKLPSARRQPPLKTFTHLKPLQSPFYLSIFQTFTPFKHFNTI